MRVSALFVAVVVILIGFIFWIASLATPCVRYEKKVVHHSEEMNPQYMPLLNGEGEVEMHFTGFAIVPAHDELEDVCVQDEDYSPKKIK